MIYLDHAATTPMNPVAIDAMQPYFNEIFTNPSAGYTASNPARKLIRTSKESLAQMINCEPDEIYFTSGGTESDNQAVFSSAQDANEKRNISTIETPTAFSVAKTSPSKRHIITTNIEHPAVLEPIKELERRGFRVTYLPVDSEGFIKPQQVADAICDDTFLISVMFANNEIGTIQPIGEIGKIAKEHRVFMHTDAVQAFTHETIDVKQMNIDLLSASAHKFGGPKGMGLLYISNRLMLKPFIFGGGQQGNMRSGTENVPGIAGMTAAAQDAMRNMNANGTYEKMLRDRLRDGLLANIQDVSVNGGWDRRLSNNLNVSIGGVEAETVLIELDRVGILASGGSACATNTGKPSHVLRALGLNERQIKGSIRFTVGPDNSVEDIDSTIEHMREIVERLRKFAL